MEGGGDGGRWREGGRERDKEERIGKRGSEVRKGERKREGGLEGGGSEARKEERKREGGLEGARLGIRTV